MFWSKLICTLIGSVLVFSSTMRVNADTAASAADWKALHYAGSKFLISLDAKVEFSTINAEAATALLYPLPGERPLQPATDSVVMLKTISSVLGSDALFTTLLDTDMRALQRSAIYSGRKDWARIYRYLPDKVYGLKAKPASDQERKGNWADWSNRSQSYFDIEPKARQLTLTEPMALFYLLRITEFRQPGDQQTFYVYDRDGTLVVNLRAEARETLKINYARHQAGKQSRVKGKTEVLRLTVDAKPLSPEKGEAEFDFMGYKDSINLYYDTNSRIVLRVTGRVDYVGNVAIDLEEAMF